MFALPQAKRVRREELDDDDASEAGSLGEEGAALRAELEAQIARSLGLEDVVYAAPRRQTILEDQIRADDDEGEPDAAPEFSFRLFRTDDTAAKIVLETDRPLAAHEGGFTGRKRPLSYYVAAPPSAEQRVQLAASALSGEEVIAMARRRWWGMEMPWRVTHVTATKKKPTAARTESASRPGGIDPSGSPAARAADAEEERRKRPGKKKRIALRIRTKAETEKEEAKRRKREEEEKKMAEKDQHVRDKKKRLNREKKIKRRAKEREKKLAATPAEGEASLSQGGSDVED